eukprot:CAMPEP_0172365510 /NCGR_PEP_ID=MMETSP1060-20121228/10105_1 /TAXON_ID=37318 /ORGANISM="Pseudo-nitzschia pungens, Strain cf. cingulata" /LENGTH=544 /DNA_ID=CAMNT_0013088839 /DNA_START=99 /DNA_END=1733 /DNA_ORIENTATION=-
MVSFRRKKNKEDGKEKVAKSPTAKEEKPAKGTPVKPPTLEDIPDLIETMLNAKGEKSAAATKRVYELCDVGHKQNRVPMVCSGKYDVLTPLAQCLTQESGDGRHLACLALNNLSIPTENKRVMALGPASKDVIGGLCKVIAEDKQESYLCCICLMNLSFLEASITTILQHSPSTDGKEVAPLENPNSLLRVLEKLLTNSPAAPKASSGKSEGVRWACGLIKNLAKSEENAGLIGQTEIPKCVVENIRAASAPPSRWTSNSLEDFSLFVILNLAQWPQSRESLIQAGAVDVIKSIMAEGDLQGLKATMACAFLDADWADFPDSGNPAVKAVSELMTNIVEKKGKDGQYAYGVFKLYTATKAYADLSKAAAKADSESGGEANSKVLAVPSAVALKFQIVSDLVLSAMDDTEGGSKYVPDAMSAEHCVSAIEAMLPALLQAGDPPRKSVQSDRACSEVSQMLLTYADISGTSPEAKASARAAADQISKAAGSARPILEISHDLWTQYRKREGQPLDQFMSEKGVEVDESGPLDFLPCAGGDSSCVIA